MTNTFCELGRDTNQARGLAEYAIEFLASGAPSAAVLERTRKFYTDANLCGLSALALKTNAPTILAAEAREYLDPAGATLLGTDIKVKSEKAIVANSAAVREWDSNGTNFGYRPDRGWTAGEFGHNDFYSVPVAAAEEAGLSDEFALKGMVLVDEIRGRLAEVFSLKSYRIDHVVHGAIASAVTYGAMRGATVDQIESGIGQFVAHYIPWRAIRAGKSLSDSKGASAAISTEVAILGMKRAMRGFLGPADIFRNPEAIFRQFQPTDEHSPFDISLGMAGDDFAVMGMHFKLGLYEHQSAGAVHGVITLLADPAVRHAGVDRIVIRAYEPAFGIIGDPAKRNPKNRQSADHSMVYIVARTIAKAQASSATHWLDLWRDCMLMPEDYEDAALFDTQTRELMSKIEFVWGGPKYDESYPDGIPTSVDLVDGDFVEHSSGMVMYPLGHARYTGEGLDAMLETKWKRLSQLCEPIS